MPYSYERDSCNIKAVGRNLARFVVRHYARYAGKWVSLRFISAKTTGVSREDRAANPPRKRA
jgi:hypothetical protein